MYIYVDIVLALLILQLKTKPNDFKRLYISNEKVYHKVMKVPRENVAALDDIRNHKRHFIRTYIPVYFFNFIFNECSRTIKKHVAIWKAINSHSKIKVENFAQVADINHSLVVTIFWKVAETSAIIWTHCRQNIHINVKRIRDIQVGELKSNKCREIFISMRILNTCKMKIIRPLGHLAQR